MTRNKYKCRFCGQFGHNAQTCRLDQERAAAIDAELAARKLAPNKHPAAWEVLAERRQAVAGKLYEALETVSTQAPAYILLREALELLKECR